MQHPPGSPHPARTAARPANHHPPAGWRPGSPPTLAVRAAVSRGEPATGHPAPAVQGRALLGRSTSPHAARLRPRTTRWWPAGRPPSGSPPAQIVLATAGPDRKQPTLRLAPGVQPACAGRRGRSAGARRPSRPPAGHALFRAPGVESTPQTDCE